MLSLIPNDGWLFSFFFITSNYLQLTKILSMIIALLNKGCQALVWHEEVTREGCVSVASFPGSPDLSGESLGT